MKPHERIPKSYYLANILNIRHYIWVSAEPFFVANANCRKNQRRRV